MKTIKSASKMFHIHPGSYYLTAEMPMEFVITPFMRSNKGRQSTLHHPEHDWCIRLTVTENTPTYLPTVGGDVRASDFYKEAIKKKLRHWSGEEMTPYYKTLQDALYLLMDELCLKGKNYRFSETERGFYLYIKLPSKLAIEVLVGLPEV